MVERYNQVMQAPQLSNNLETVLRLLENDDLHALQQFLHQRHPSEIADLIESIKPDQRNAIWKSVDTEFAGEVLTELNDGVLTSLVDDIDQQRLVESMTHLDTDDIADLIPDLPESIVADVLFAIDQETRKSLGEVLAFPEDSAGGLMNTDVIVVRDDITFEVAIRFLRLKENLPKNTDTIFLLNRKSELTGILAISKLITTGAHEAIRNHIINDPIIFNALDKDDEVAKSFADYNLVSAPVVDENKKLVGRITVDDVVDVILEDAEQEVFARAGLKQEEDIFAPVAKSTKNRALWLGVNLITALIGSWVIKQFEGTIQQLVALAVLMPIVASMGGNAGTQTLTIVIRGLSNGTIQRQNLMQLLSKEILVGSLNGLIWACAIALIAAFWFNSLQLGYIIALAMLINLIVSAISGVLLPVILDKFNIDPALAGGVALTTVTDVVGYFAVLGLAAVFLL